MAFDRTTPAAVNPADPGAPAPVRYALDFGHTYVPSEEVTDFILLGEAEQAALAAWGDALIPGNDAWPSASEADAHLYADNCAARAPRHRALLTRAIAQVESAARERSPVGFAQCPKDDREAILRELETGDDAELFEFVLELVFEGYYRDPRVLEVVEERTGFRTRAPVDGVALQDFDESLVEEMRGRPPFVREVPT